MEKCRIIWICFFSAVVAYLLGQNDAAVPHFFDVGGVNESVEKIQPIPKAYNQCYVNVGVYNSTSHKYGLAGAKVTVLSRKLKSSSTTDYDYTGFSEEITGSTGRVCLLVHCHAEGLIFVEKNSVRIFAASKSTQKIPPNFKVNIKYNNEMVSFHSFVWGTILNHTGPVYTNRERGICGNATLQDYHFIFSYVSIPDILVSTPVPMNYTDPTETRIWNYGILDSDKRTCYLKILIKTQSTRTEINTYSHLNSPAGEILGVYKGGAKYDISSNDFTSKAACLQFRCPTKDLNDNDMNTYVTGTITDNGSPFCCKSYKENPNTRVSYGMNGTSFSTTFEVGKAYGPVDGVYMSNTLQQARSRCFTGHDFLGVEYAMNVSSGFAMEYDCTATCTNGPNGQIIG